MLAPGRIRPENNLYIALGRCILIYGVEHRVQLTEGRDESTADAWLLVLVLGRVNEETVSVFQWHNELRISEWGFDLPRDGSKNRLMPTCYHSLLLNVNPWRGWRAWGRHPSTADYELDHFATSVQADAAVAGAIDAVVTRSAKSGAVTRFEKAKSIAETLAAFDRYRRGKSSAKVAQDWAKSG